MAKRKTKFMCKSCGYESPKWMGRCPGCGEWNTMDEEVEVAVQKGPRGAFQHTDNVRQKAMPISAIEIVEEPRIGTDLEELNRVLGGGIVPGSLILIGGDPGIGKSTLLLQVSSLLRIKGSVFFIFQVRNQSVRRNYVQNDLAWNRMNFIFMRKRILGKSIETIAEVKPTVCHRGLDPNRSSSGSDVCTGKCIASA